MNNGRRPQIILIIINIIVVCLAMNFVLEHKDYSANQKEKSYLIGASYMTMNNKFYKILSEEIVARVEAEGTS